jgi:hypothetical protein
MLARERDDRPRDLAEVREVLARHAEGVASEPPPAMARLPIASARHAGPGLEVLPTETQKPLVRWDTGVPHAVPNGQRPSRPFISRIPAALAAVATAGVVAWGIVRSVRPPPPLHTPGAANSIVAPPPATTVLEPPSTDVASTSENRLRPTASSSQPNGTAAPRRAHVTADAGMTARKDAPALASASATPVGSAPPKAQRGGLFEAVPF